MSHETERYARALQAGLANQKVRKPPAPWSGNPATNPETESLEAEVNSSPDATGHLALADHFSEQNLPHRAEFRKHLVNWLANDYETAKGDSQWSLKDGLVSPEPKLPAGVSVYDLKTHGPAHLRRNSGWTDPLSAEYRPGGLHFSSFGHLVAALEHAYIRGLGRPSREE